MKHLYAFFCLFLLSNVVTADSHILTLEQLFQRNIVGAFGQKLGAVVNENLGLPAYTSTNGALAYEFKPDKPYHAFDHYRIYATPVSKTIYKIYMSGGAVDFDCSKERKVLKSVISDKYPALILSFSYGSGKTSYFQQQDKNRRISISCENPQLLEMAYVDFLLEEQVVEELASQVDKSNF